MEIQIKKFYQLSPDQLYQLLKLRVDVFVVEQNCAYPELDNMDKSAAHVFVEDSDEIKVYLRLHILDDEKAKISRVVTAKDFRGKGASRELVEAALNEIRKQGRTKSVFLQAQDYLTGFYESFGFKNTSEVYLEDGIPHIDMEMMIIQ